MLTLGTGVGGGVVIDGRIFRGAQGLGAELGHFSIIADGRPAGQLPQPGLPRGALQRHGARAGGDGARQGPAGHEARGHLRGEGPGERAARPWPAQDGDPEARLLFDRLGTWLGIGIAGYVNVFEPEHVLIGAGSPEPRTCSSTAPRRRRLARAPPSGSG